MIVTWTRTSGVPDTTKRQLRRRRLLYSGVVLIVIKHVELLYVFIQLRKIFSWNGKFAFELAGQIIGNALFGMSRWGIFESFFSFFFFNGSWMKFFGCYATHVKKWRQILKAWVDRIDQQTWVVYSKSLYPIYAKKCCSRTPSQSSKKKELRTHMVMWYSIKVHWGMFFRSSPEFTGWRTNA